MNSRNSRLQIKFRIRKAFVVRMLMLAVLPALLLSACALSDVSDLPTLYDVLGDRKTRSVIPEENEGLLINLSDTLLTPRRSVYDALCGEYPIYGHLKEMVDSPDNHIFRLGDHAREFISGMEAALCEELAQTVGYGENH